MPMTLSKTVRVTEAQWNRVENAARKRNESPNRLLVQLAMEALDRREWPRTEAEILLFRSAIFSAQAIARNMIAKGREDEVEEIRKDISEFAPESPGKPSGSYQDQPNSDHPPS